MTDRPPKSRDASKPVSWDDRTEDENIAAHNLWLNMEHLEDVAMAVCSHDKAIELLALAAGYLERREDMPYPLADHIAKAFRTTVSAFKYGIAAQGGRDALASALKLTAPGKRPAVDTQQVGNSIFRVMLGHAQDGSPITETAASKEVACMLGKKHRTIKDHWVKWKDSNPEKYELMNRFLKGYKKLGG